MILRRLRRFAPLGLAAVAVLFVTAACETPDTSFKTSPSVRLLLGTTTGDVVMNPPEQPPPTPREPASGWTESSLLTMFTKLQNGTPAILVQMELSSRPGAGMEVWLAKQGGPQLARWSAGTTTQYGGTVCFQMAIQENGEMLPLDTQSTYQMTVDFVDANGNALASQTTRVTGYTPQLKGTPPAPGSNLFALAYTCPTGN